MAIIKIKYPEELTSTEVVSFLANTMLRHIGSGNSITGKKLFIKLFGECPDKIKKEFLWTRVLRAMQSLRLHSNMFIVSERTAEGVIYFVVKTAYEAREYKSRCSRIISGLEKQKLRCDRAVKEKFYKRLEKGQLYPVKRLK